MKTYRSEIQHAKRAISFGVPVRLTKPKVATSDKRVVVALRKMAQIADFIPVAYLSNVAIFNGEITTIKGYIPVINDEAEGVLKYTHVEYKNGYEVASTTYTIEVVPQETIYFIGF